MLREYSTKELKLWYNEARDNWIKIKKFVEKYKDDEGYVNNLEKITTPENEEGYIFDVGDISIILTLYPKFETVHSCFGWNDNGSIKSIALIIPTVIQQNEDEYKGGKNILQMFYEQYDKHLTQSVFIHELVHLVQVRRHYDYQSIQALNYIAYKHKASYDDKASYFDNELEAPVYALQLLWDYKHDDKVKEILDRYREKTSIYELEPLYKEFKVIDHKALDILWLQAFYHMSPETTLYILDILNRMI